ncbi:serine/threonine protein kinase [Gordonia sp. (in: high G+C Gram-positive bacteria)]|uniref:serine/threonine protein kinase n=1 Tax=Gordonia sp. (in: high G+C Gram-positive bacteria) TaxID=84139 RepID=UPI003BB64650
MGQVYLVENPALHRLEALKVLSTGAGAAMDFGERFAREARTAAGLQHPNIITVHAYGVEGGDPWFTMSYLDGEDLSQADLTDDEISEVAKQTASALDYAHHRGVIHRDIKPANIVITRDHNGELATVTVLDFGIAKLANATGLTGTNMFIGTLAYSAPEMIEGEVPTGAADQYSLACTLYELFSGEPPFAADSHVALMRAHLDKLPGPIGVVDPDLHYLDAPFARALSKSPTARYASCQEFAQHLDAPNESRAAAAELYAPTEHTEITTPPIEKMGPASNPAARPDEPRQLIVSLPPLDEPDAALQRASSRRRSAKAVPAKPVSAQRSSRRASSPAPRGDQKAAAGIDLGSVVALAALIVLVLAIIIGISLKVGDDTESASTLPIDNSVPAAGIFGRSATTSQAKGDGLPYGGGVVKCDRWPDNPTEEEVALGQAAGGGERGLPYRTNIGDTVIRGDNLHFAIISICMETDATQEQITDTATVIARNIRADSQGRRF